jgi:hypothetical protein
VAEQQETYTVQEAARVLKRTPEEIGRMLRSGELSGEHEDGDERKPWRVHKWSAHVLHDRLREDRPAVDRLPPPEILRGATGATGSASEPFRVQDLRREVRRLEHRLELSERGESTLREELVRERRLVEEERARADAERKRAEGLRRELEAERSKGLWPRLFGS